MRIYSWNVNGIRSVLQKGALQQFLHTHRPDILCLQETRAQRQQVVVDFPDYIEHWHSAARAGYGGTAIFTRDQPMGVLYGFVPAVQNAYHFPDRYGDPTTEGRVLTVEFLPFYLCTVYTPNAKRDLSRLDLRYSTWDPAFLAHCHHLEQTKPVIFCGDLNVAHQAIDLARPQGKTKMHGFTIEERRGIDNILQAGYFDTFRERFPTRRAYTWWSNYAGARERDIGWRIDYFFASERLRTFVTDAQIHPTVFGSDHCPISITIENPKKR